MQFLANNPGGLQTLQQASRDSRLCGRKALDTPLSLLFCQVNEMVVKKGQRVDKLPSWAVNPEGGCAHGRMPCMCF